MGCVGTAITVHLARVFNIHLPSYVPRVTIARSGTVCHGDVKTAPIKTILDRRPVSRVLLGTTVTTHWKQLRLWRVENVPKVFIAPLVQGMQENLDVSQVLGQTKLNWSLHLSVMFVRQGREVIILDDIIE